MSDPADKKTPAGQKKKRRFPVRVTLNAPVTLIFTGLCVLAFLINKLTAGAANRILFSVAGGSFANPLTYVRLFTHVLGHSSLSHLVSNLMYILILGPMIEEKYGWKNLTVVIVVTAFLTGLVHIIFFRHAALLGASGVAFAMILLASITGFEDHTIPLTLILVAVLYLGREVWYAFSKKDNISQFTHVIGGLVGTVLGYLMNHRKQRDPVKS